MHISLGTYSIRDWEADDAASLAKHANNFNVWRNLLDRFPHPYTRSDAREWIRNARQERPPVSFAIASPTEAIGGIGLQRQTDVAFRSAEVGYWLGEPYWGLGIATAALRAFTAWAFDSGLELERLFAHVFEWNSASARVLGKAGYTLEGRLRKHVFKDGQLIDLLVYGRLRTDQPPA